MEPLAGNIFKLDARQGADVLAPHARCVDEDPAVQLDFVVVAGFAAHAGGPAVDPDDLRDLGMGKHARAVFPGVEDVRGGEPEGVHGPVRDPDGGQ